MSKDVMLSVIYLPIEEATQTRQMLANQTLHGIEIVELKNCSELEMLYKFKEVLPQVNGKYVTLVCEGDEFEENYFEKMINRMEKRKAKVAVSTQIQKDIYKKVPDECVFNLERYKTSFVDAEKECVCPINLNGTIIQTKLLDEYKLRDKGIETQKDFFIRMFLKEKKYLYVPNIHYAYYVCRDDGFKYFTGMVEYDWYFKSFEEFLLPLLKELKEKGKVPKFVQYIAMYMINSRFEANSNNRNKHIIEGKEEVDKLLKVFNEVMKYIEYGVVLNIDNLAIHTSVTDLKKLYIQIKEWDFELKFNYLQNDKGISLVYGDYVIASSDNMSVNIQLIDYVDGKWKIDFSVPNYFSTEEVRYFIAVDDKEYDVEYDGRYSLTKYFGESAYKRVTGKCYVNLDPDGNKQKLRFYVEYKGTRYKLSFEFKSHTSRLSGKPRFSYWNFSKYTAYLETGKDIVIAKRKKSTTIYREFRCILEMLMSKRKTVYILLLIRLAYLATRPFYKKKTIWMFYDKLYKGGDSSEYLYKYCKAQKDKIKTYYILDRKSADYKRMKKEGYRPIIRNSPKHFLTFMNASMMVVSNSTVFAFHNLSLANSAYLKGFIDFHVCCVQHGLSIQKIAIAQQRLRDNTRLYFCASKYEIENLSKPVYDYEGSDALKLTGVPRYDGLVNEDKKQILLAPTWRMQSALLVSRNEGLQRDYNPHFKESEYYKVYNSLINDERLINAAKEYGYRIHYVLHPIVSTQSEDFDKNDYVDIIPSVGDMSYEKEFRESSLMVTDFSGVQFDFAYMRKPVVYLHHKDIPQHYEEGTFMYDTMGFGEICHDNDELIDLLVEYMKNNCKMKDEYRKRADDFFCYSDRNNCERIYAEMIKYQNKLWEDAKK